MWGLIWILLFTLGLGFIAGYRYSKSRFSIGSTSGYGSNASEAANAFRTPIRRVENAKPVDPVCHKAVSPERAKPSVCQDVIYYFCSRECREIFEADPDSYVSNVSTRGSGLAIS